MGQLFAPLAILALGAGAALAGARRPRGRRPLAQAPPRRDLDREQAGDPATPAFELAVLSHHPDPLVRWQVAMNPSTDGWTRERLDADDELEALRRGYGEGREERAARSGTWPWSIPGDLDAWRQSVAV
jgi:hypothetical protein